MTDIESLPRRPSRISRGVFGVAGGFNIFMSVVLLTTLVLPGLADPAGEGLIFFQFFGFLAAVGLALGAFGFAMAWRPSRRGSLVLGALLLVFGFFLLAAPQIGLIDMVLGVAVMVLSRRV